MRHHETPEAGGIRGEGAGETVVGYYTGSYRLATIDQVPPRIVLVGVGIASDVPIAIRDDEDFACNFSLSSKTVLCSSYETVRRIRDVHCEPGERESVIVV